MPAAEEVTRLLIEWKQGSQTAVDALVPLVYDEMRRLAQSYLRDERAAATLRPTALVHEAYLRLVAQRLPDWESRSHFFGVAAHLMRQILVQYARRRNAAKRNGGNRVALDNVRLDSAVALFPKQSVDLVALNEALNALAKLDAQQSTIVELRFFAGLSIEETSRVLGVSPATIKRDWTTARIWLSRQMGAETPHDHP